MSHVVVLVPGIMGSVLKLGDEVIWPGSLSSLIIKYDKMKKLLSPDLEATDCIRSFYLTQYQDIIDQFEAWGFTEANRTLVIAAYDWRKTNSDSAKTLAKRIDEIIARDGNNVRISLVAHSMGGLVSRYFLESGDYDNSPGWNAVEDFISIAVPHRGAAVALPVVAGLEKRLFLSAEQVKELCDDPRYPSAYELLPHRNEPVAWDGSVSNAINSVDFYNTQTADKLGLKAQSLAAAVSFHSKLANGKRPAHTAYFCFAGTRETTASYVRLRDRANGSLRPDKVDQSDAGDGTVPIWSSTLPQTRLLYVPGEHGTIYQGALVKQHLGALLGIEGMLAVGAPTELAVLPPVVNPDKNVSVRLIFAVASNVTALKGNLTFERITLGADEKVSNLTIVAKHPVEYDGPAIESFLLKLTSPDKPGHYRVTYVDETGVEPSTSAELIVQDG
jgi:phospholipase A1